jgi:hypothetical protein
LPLVAGELAFKPKPLKPGAIDAEQRGQLGRAHDLETGGQVEPFDAHASRRGDSETSRKAQAAVPWPAYLGGEVLERHGGDAAGDAAGGLDLVEDAPVHWQ